METRTLEIVGRETELAAIDALLDGAHGEGGSALLLEGPAGVTAAVTIWVTTLAVAPRELRRHRARQQAGPNATPDKSSVPRHVSLGAGRV